MRVFLLTVLALPALVSAADAGLNPVTRIVQLMEGLIKKTTADGKAEEDLFQTYVCWYKTVVSSKKASNAEAANRIEALTAFIDDVKSGRVEFTSERKDLEAEIEKLSTEIETATDMRKKENEDFLAAKDEMDKAIAALELAVEILGDMASSKEGVLAALNSDVRKAVDLGKLSLSTEDARFLEQALDGQVPDVDWKKLNRKATFKMKYKARSLKIQEILADMLQTFQDNLADAKKTEKTAKSTFDTLMTSKNEQLTAAQEALSGGEGEGAARSLSMEESQEEVDALTTQVSNDEKYISQAEASYAAKVAEWKERKSLRTEEIASISKAISILASDDAKDTMSSSFKSQGNFFLQNDDESARCSPRRRGHKAIEKLKQGAEKHNDARLAALAVSVSMNMGSSTKTKGHFDAIVKSIDKMISDLHSEYDADMTTKEQCEADRMENTKKAKKAAQAMDDQTALMNRKKAQIADCQNEIAAIDAKTKETRLQRDEATVARNKEKLEYEAAKSDDEAAAKLIMASKSVLEKFYQDNGLALAQTKAKAKQPEVVAGEAPPPPPSTFSEPYGGAKGETNGIISLLEMVHADVEKDIKTATKAENDSIADFDNFMSSSQTLLKNIAADKSALEGEIGDAETAISDARTLRGEKKAFLDDTMKFLRSIAPSCDYMAVNFELRKSNREAEVDGLMGAKTALLGGTDQKPVNTMLVQEPCP
jgi:predicted  nucleic acid-binding Zn-ribbon protein